jgi:sulfonate transport system permease protein
MNRGFGASLRTTHSNRWLLVAVLALLATWELVARLVVAHDARPDSVLPTVEHTLATFKHLSNYWTGGWGVRATQDGGTETYRGAVLAVGDGVLTTGSRLLFGMAIAVVLGVGGGLLIGYTRAVRRFAFGPLNFLGVLPLLAMLPLFAFWFGATSKAAVIFIAFGAGVTILRATINAVDNVPSAYLDYARTLGASRLRVYRTVIVPAILPELRGGIAIALTFSWSLALGAELVGIQSGLGRMMILAVNFSQVDRMFLIALVFIALAAATVIAFDRLADHLIRWAD